MTTREIPKEQWTRFCEMLSRDRQDWQTSVQVLSSGSGAQMLSDGLPFIGLTYERGTEGEIIELTTGTGGDIHQTHSIFDPQKLAIEGEDEQIGGVLDIEDNVGTKTLVRFIRPASFPAAFVKGDLMAV